MLLAARFVDEGRRDRRAFAGPEWGRNRNTRWVVKGRITDFRHEVLAREIPQAAMGSGASGCRWREGPRNCPAQEKDLSQSQSGANLVPVQGRKRPDESGGRRQKSSGACPFFLAAPECGYAHAMTNARSEMEHAQSPISAVRPTDRQGHMRQRFTANKRYIRCECNVLGN
jgi:hypothetical protein